MEKIITFYDTIKESFIITKRIVFKNEYDYIIINEGIINKNQVFDTIEEAIQSLKRSNYIISGDVYG